MIIVRIANGLGNQMFQYALGRALAIKNKTEFVLDISSFDHQNPNEAERHYTLDVFTTASRIASPDDFKRLGIPNPLRQDIFAKIERKFSKKIVVESTHVFIPEILDIRDNRYLIGVWQSEKYFKDVGDSIRKDFSLKNPLSPNAKVLERLICTSESVAVHVRRGDQVHNTHLAKKHGVLTDEYYQNSTTYIKNKINSPRFFIFSDEPEWVKENLDFRKDVVYVSEYGIPDYEEIILMSLCKHAIIAKSSYSWWGAWLNTNPNKIVITPKNRFGSAAMYDGDLIPESWIRI